MNFGGVVMRQSFDTNRRTAQIQDIRYGNCGDQVSPAVVRDISFSNDYERKLAWQQGDDRYSILKRLRQLAVEQLIGSR
jgi:hypothetical protein